MTRVNLGVPGQNPLAARMAAVPEASARLASRLGRVLAGFGALAVAYDESYDRTMVYGLALAALMMLSLVPLPRRVSTLAVGLACGLAFFAGAILADQGEGIILIFSGAIGAVGHGILAHRRGTLPSAVSGFFLGSGLAVAIVAAIVLSIEG